MKNNQEERKMTTSHFLYIADIIDEESKVWLSQLAKPDFVGRKPVPDDLNHLTLGEYIDLKDTTEETALFNPCKIVLKMNEIEILDADIAQVYGFSLWTMKEVGKISELFASCKARPTSEEREAGVEDLDFGIFGLLDYYAQRMHIQDHDDVLRTPWVRVYAAMHKDYVMGEYQRRLNKVYDNKAKKRK